MHTCDGCVYCKSDGSCMRDYDEYMENAVRKPNWATRLIAWVWGLFHREE